MSWVALGAIAPMIILGSGTPMPVAPVTLSPPATEQTGEIAVAGRTLVSVPGIAQGQVSCAPGQFASPFSDVLPEHWAYEAVTRLASVPSHCFDAAISPRSLTP